MKNNKGVERNAKGVVWRGKDTGQISTTGKACAGRGAAVLKAADGRHQERPRVHRNRAKPPNCKSEHKEFSVPGKQV